MLALLDDCLTYKYIAVDTEGFLPKTLGISIATPMLQDMYFPVGHIEDVNIDAEVRDRLYYVLKTVPYRIFHNAAHDITVLPELWDLPFICTMIMGHMVDENLMSKSLDFMHKFHCGGEGKQRHPLMQAIIDTLGWYHVPYMLINEYACWDARITMQLFLKLLPMYEEQFGPLWSAN